MITILNIIRFYPYSSVRARKIMSIEDDTNTWYNAIREALEHYEIELFFNCSANYFRLAMDNKITIAMNTGDDILYVSLYDGKVTIGTEIFTVNGGQPVHATLKRKSK